MDQTRARELQEKLALEAAAMLSLAGSGAETAPYEQAVSLIGKAWRLTAEETSEQLALIEQEKAVMGRIENGESAEHIRQELLLNWSGRVSRCWRVSSKPLPYWKPHLNADPCSIWPCS